MKNSSKTMVLTYAERCKNILASNWRAHLHTIKADSKGSKEDIHSSSVKYLFKKGKPYIWVQEGDLHNVNTIIDERGSLSISSPIPGPLMSLLRSLKKLPARVALIGDVVPVRDEKVQFVSESLQDTILLEQKSISEASYSVSGIVSSAGIGCRSKIENLQDLVDRNDSYVVYRFNIRSCSYIDGSASAHEVEPKDVESSKADLLSPFSEMLIDGINQNQARRRALMLFCLVHFNASARDAVMLAIDRKGFDVLGKVPGMATSAGISQYQWKEFRFSFNEEVHNIEEFCSLLVEMEDAALNTVRSYSGLG